MGRDPDAEQAVEERRRVVAGEERAVEVGQRAVEVGVRPEQRDDRLEVAVGHVGHVEADQRDAHGHHPRRGPALAAYGAQRRPRRPSPGRAASGADRDVERHEQRHAEAHQREVQRGDVVGISQRHVGGVRRDQSDEHGEEGDERSRQHAAPAGRRRGRAVGGRLARASRGAARGLLQRPRAHQAGAGSGAGIRRAVVRGSTPVSARARARAQTAMRRPPRSSTT